MLQGVGLAASVLVGLWLITVIDDYPVLGTILAAFIIVSFFLFGLH
jgi:hypothetical protein